MKRALKSKLDQGITGIDCQNIVRPTVVEAVCKVKDKSDM